MATEFYLNTQPGHNKYYVVTQNNREVTINYGRIGTKGQRLHKEFPGIYQANSFARQKIAEKNNKGYLKVDERLYNTRTLEASLLGTQNKLDSLHWLDITKETGGTPVEWRQLSEDQLQDPNYNIGVLVTISTIRSGTHEILFYGDRIYILHGPIVIVPLTSEHPLYHLASKASEVISNRFC